MFCPRCGKAVNDNANFCGGCGLAKSEINRITTPSAPPSAPLTTTVPSEEITPIDILPVSDPRDAQNDCNFTISDTIATTPTESDMPVLEGMEQTESSYEEKTTSYSASYDNQNGYNYAVNSTQATYGGNDVAPPTADPKTQPLSTVDFIWMMILGGLPIVGLFYLGYLAFIQNNNTNKRSYARAALLLGLFGVLIGCMFFFGFFISHIIF